MAQGMLTTNCCSCTRNARCIMRASCTCLQRQTVCINCKAKLCRNNGEDNTAITPQHIATLHVETQQARLRQAPHQTSGVFAATSARNSGIANSMMEVNSAPVRAQEAAARREAKAKIASMSLDEAKDALNRLADEQPLVTAPYIGVEAAPYERLTTQDKPAFCSCGNCLLMDSHKDRICCRYSTCITEEHTFIDICMKQSVVEICGVTNYGRTFANKNPTYSNRKYRHCAYRFFQLWQEGHMGPGNRKRCPSCVVARIRWRYPDPNQTYTGYASANEGISSDEDEQVE